MGVKASWWHLIRNHKQEDKWNNIKKFLEDQEDLSVDVAGHKEPL